MTTIYKDEVHVNDYVFNTATPLYWDFRIDALQGWEDTADLDPIVVEYEVADGGSAGYFPAKVKYVQCEGYVTAGTRTGTEDIKRLLGTIFARNTDLVIQRYGPVPKQITFRRASKIEYPTDLPVGVRFLMTLVAVDPFKYSVTETIVTTGISTPDESGRIYPRVYPLVYDPVAGADTGNLGVNFFNAGNSSSYPISVVEGPLTAGGWQIVNDTTGQRLTFDVSLAAGQILTIDHANHLLQFNGYPYVARAEGEWWPLIPGDNFVRLTSSVFDAAASLELHARSAWE